jgi:hypothetical protein
MKEEVLQLEGVPWEEEVGRKGEEAIWCLRKDCGKGKNMREGKESREGRS